MSVLHSDVLLHSLLPSLLSVGTAFLSAYTGEFGISSSAFSGKHCVGGQM